MVHAARVLAKFASDLVLWVGSGLLALLLAGPDLSPLPSTVVVWLIAGLVLKLALVHAFGTYRQSWQMVSTHDIRNLTAALAVHAVAMTAVVLAVDGDASRSMGWVPTLEALIAFVTMSGARLAQRALQEWRYRRSLGSAPRPQRVLLAGAGSTGARVAREVKARPGGHIHLLGFVDDDVNRHRLVIGGLPVLGTIDDIPRLAEDLRVDEVFITMSEASPEAVRRVVGLARDAGVGFRIVAGDPALQVGLGKPDAPAQRGGRAREVRVEDLLQREPVDLSLDDVAHIVVGKVILVTGAGGSIGAEMVRQCAALLPARIVLMDHDENALSSLDHELSRTYPQLQRALAVGSVRDRKKLETLMQHHRPDTVFHLAAHKHVPLLEAAPDEAVLNNVGGTLNVCRAALRAGVTRFVHTSSDKAVNPSSMLGSTKLIAERIVRHLVAGADGEAVYVSVRFGNVLGSQGSVVSVFRDQIAAGGPVTVTHPDMTRYFMTIEEAARLVIQAGGIARNGEVCFLDMGTPVRIRDLAEDMILLGAEEPSEVKIDFVGLRPGEKIHEELEMSGETIVPTSHSRISVARAQAPIGTDFMDLVERLLQGAEARDSAEVDALLAKLVGDVKLPLSAG